VPNLPKASPVPNHPKTNPAQCQPGPVPTQPSTCQTDPKPTKPKASPVPNWPNANPVQCQPSSNLLALPSPVAVPLQNCFLQACTLCTSPSIFLDPPLRGAMCGHGSIVRGIDRVVDCYSHLHPPRHELESLLC